MKNLIKAVKILALSALITTSAYAEEGNTYFGIGIVQSKWSDSGSINFSGISVASNLEYKKANYKALIGKRLNNNLAIEGQYTNFAKDNLGVISVSGVAAPNTNLNGNWTTTYSGKSFGVAGVYYFSPEADFSPFVKLGAHSWDLKTALTKDTLSATVDTDGTDAFYGVGIDGKINELMKYRIEFEGMKFDDENISNIGVGLLFGF